MEENTGSSGFLSSSCFCTYFLVIFFVQCSPGYHVCRLLCFKLSKHSVFNCTANKNPACAVAWHRRLPIRGVKPRAQQKKTPELSLTAPWEQAAKFSLVMCCCPQEKLKNRYSAVQDVFETHGSTRSRPGGRVVFFAFFFFFFFFYLLPAFAAAPYALPALKQQIS